LLAQNALAARAQRYAEIQANLGTISADEFARARWSWEQAARAIELAQEVVAARADDVALARDAYLAASRAVEVLERLDQRRREEYAVEAGRAEIAEVDDIVNGRRAYVLQASAS
jgi:flagellar export protein FliJ